ncbi:hypothetical protein [Deinococcus cellulosilyticus]|uniref:Uncharacterized protein n=1 Tax=Deinococcus cellulosilyticus (strain DSM 18568 / NBRC 106333 / KACC 11606 / 5516J-15) TaxID=1223518 RepID=A0A511MYP9_DEIC1|nr:hypothetical protein [Deinococcus cellulosilyticus]GEM45703.1 hypothetical protein DC3_13380 [Deinococcus cellulosilyticus NBRC 106333 = KACC 11606]
MIEHPNEDTPDVNPGDPAPYPVPDPEITERPELPDMPDIQVPNTQEEPAS